MPNFTANMCYTHRTYETIEVEAESIDDVHTLIKG